ncbi:hypothetical protein CCP4SC76_7640015 [Gammaproteobacteria bacterium]
MDIRESLARAICKSCDENPNDRGDALGNDYRWQDYLDSADAAVSVFPDSKNDVISERIRCAQILMDMPLESEYMNGHCKAMEWDGYHRIKGTHETDDSEGKS